MILSLSNDVRVDTLFVSSVDLKRAQLVVPDPEVPKSYIKSQDRWEENYNHPDYHRAIHMAAIKREKVLWAELLRIGCKLVSPLPEGTSWIRRLIRYDLLDDIVNDIDLTNEDDLRYAYVFSECAKRREDMEKIVSACTITEADIRRFVHMIGVRRGGLYIDEAPVSHSIETGISSQAMMVGSSQVVSPMDEYNACVAAGLNWLSWRRGEYEKEFMVEAIAFNRIKMHINNHQSDAQQEHAEREARKNRNKK